MQKIALLIVYFGKFPWYFPLFVKSCMTNPSIDFLILSDAHYEGVLPSNVTIIPFTLSQFNKLATQKLDFEVVVQNPYKLCEFKPAFGFLFSEYLQEYDFWGMTDIDVIYGRIREFITPEILDTYDVICVRNDYITACCMLFRNTDYVNSLFKKSKDYEMVFTTSRYFGFDETNFEQQTIIEKEDIFKLNCEIETMQHIVLREEAKGNLTVHFDLLVCDGNPGKMKWDKGLLSYHNQFEILLYHLQNYKNNIFSRNSFVWNDIPNTFYIDKYGYRKKNFIWSYISIFYTDYIKPLLWNCNKRANMFLSSLLFKNKLKTLEEGEYQYILSKRKIFIAKKENDANWLKFQDSKEYQLYNIVFCKDYFFAKGLNMIFKMNPKANNTHRTFSIIARSGFAIAYNKIE